MNDYVYTCTPENESRERNVPEKPMLGNLSCCFGCVFFFFCFFLTRILSWPCLFFCCFFSDLFHKILKF